MESAYEQCLARELSLADISFEVQVPLPVEYKGVRLDCGYRVDLLIEKKLILELKVVEKFLPIHEAQLLTYMRLANASVGLLINFNVELLKEGGIKRFVLYNFVGFVPFVVEKRTSGMMSEFVICVYNESNPASLIVGKVYRRLPDREAKTHNMIRIIDEDLSEPQKFGEL